MIKLLIAGIILCTILFLTCSKDTEAEIDVTYQCKNLYFTDDSSRSTTRTLKGHILFSWRNNNSSWNYSIVPNLNISAASENVSIGNSFTGEECLKKNLYYFAEGEEVFWDGNHNIETVEGKKIKLSYPPDYIVRDILCFSDSINIKMFFE